jgi:hypothetical protein
MRQRGRVVPAGTETVNDGVIGVVVFMDNKPFQFSFEATQLRGSIPASKLNAKDLRELMLPGIVKAFGRVK